MRFLLTVLAGLLYALGWVAGKVSLLVGWCWAAVAVGWDEARTRPARRARGPRVVESRLAGR